MTSDSQTLGEALPGEIERCRKLLDAYREIGPVGNFGAAMIRLEIDAAVRATATGDVVAMLRAYESLKGCK